MFKKAYVLRDSNNRYSGKISLVPKNIDGSGLEWFYSSETFGTRCHTIKENAEIDLQKLNELNVLAGFDLTWTLEELTGQQMDELAHKGLELKFDNRFGHSQSRDVQKGYIGKHRRLFTEICRKYKSQKVS